jgi:glycosyltransferase involved in cell wall biosynthesis
VTGPLVTIGLPVFRGAETLPAVLECFARQSYPNLDILISVDGADQASAESCKPFLERDGRFRMHVQTSRLGWDGNTDWTIQNRRGDFYTYQQHDDVVSPTYVEDLVDAASRRPDAAICFSKMIVTAKHRYTVRNRSVDAPEPLMRAQTQLERFDVGMLRGLIRSSALGDNRMRRNRFEGFGSEQVFLIELALRGAFVFVEGPMYFKNIHGGNLHLKWIDWSEQKKILAWAWLAAEIVEVLLPYGLSFEDRRRLFFQVLERFCLPTGKLKWLRSLSRWTHRQKFEGLYVPLRALIELVRRDGRFEAWARSHSRTMVLDFGKREQRAAFLDAVLAELRTGRTIDVAEALRWDWGELERAVATHFAQRSG